MTGNQTKNNSKLIWGALAVTLSLVTWTAFQEDDSTTEAVEVADVRQIKNQTSTIRKKGDEAVPNVIKQSNHLIDWDKLNRSGTIENPAILFSEHSWVVEPPKPKVVEMPPPPPVAPPVPFAYMGRFDNSPKGNLIYLATADQSYSVGIGKNVDNFWKLEKEDANNLYFTYLPLNLPQVLDKNQRIALPESNLASTSDIVNAFQQ
jgi:hypothetical protein